MKVPTTASSPASGRKPPNLVFVFPDQMRGSALGFLGEEPVFTPHLDRFAGESLVLTQAASCYPVCSPFRAMFMTGKYPHANKVIDNCTSNSAPYGCELQEADPCWSDVLQGLGYDLGYIGKWHLDSPRPPYVNTRNNHGDLKWNEWCPPHRRHGFAYWYAYGTYDDHLKPMYWRTGAGRHEFHYVEQWGPEHEADQAIAYINNKDGSFRDPEKPFALVVSMNPPHTGYDLYPGKYGEPYRDKKLEDLCKRPNIPPAGTPWGDHYRRHIRDYYGQITGVDEQFGRIVQAIDHAGLGEDTIIVFTSDHGDCVGIHNQITKNNPYEESFRIPFMLRWKGKIHPRRDDLLLSPPDIYPSLLDLIGHGRWIPPAVQGSSYAGIMASGEGQRPEAQLYFSIPHAHPAGGLRGIRTHRYTLVLEKEGRRVMSLWDRRDDPYQLRDISEEKPGVIEELIPELEYRLGLLADPWITA